MRHAWGWGVMAAVVFGAMPAASAGEAELMMNSLLNKLVARGVLTPTDAQEIRRDVTAEMAQQAAAPSSATIAQHAPTASAPMVAWHGDLRLRNEYRDRSSNSDGNRQRVRFRLGMKAPITDELDVGARLVTGTAPGDLTEGSEPGSTQQTFSDTFAKKHFNLDQAYVHYHPEAPVDQLHIWGGLFENPYSSTQLVWDSDLAFAGAALQLRQQAGPAEWFATGGIFPIDSDGFGTDAPTLYGLQGGAVVAPGIQSGTEVLDALKIKAALGYYDYANAVKNAVINTSSGNTASAEDFNELNPSLEISSTVAGVPVSGWSDWVYNTSASDQAHGVQFGVRLGKAKKPWSLKDGVELSYAYERLEQNAAFDAFVDSDFGGGGTNHQGHIWSLTVATLKNSTATLKFSNAEEVEGAKAHEDRLQLDWSTTF